MLRSFPSGNGWRPFAACSAKNPLALASNGRATMRQHLVWIAALAALAQRRRGGRDELDFFPLRLHALARDRPADCPVLPGAAVLSALRRHVPAERLPAQLDHHRQRATTPTTRTLWRPGDWGLQSGRTANGNVPIGPTPRRTRGPVTGAMAAAIRIPGWRRTTLGRILMPPARCSKGTGPIPFPIRSPTVRRAGSRSANFPTALAAAPGPGAVRP